MTSVLQPQRLINSADLAAVRGEGAADLGRRSAASSSIFQVASRPCERVCSLQRLILSRRAATPGPEAPDGATSRWEPDMENLIARVAATAGATPDVARKAVALVLDFIAREAPDDAVAALLAKAPELKAIIASSATTGGEGMGPTVRGLMGTGAGAMGGGGLMALGSRPDGARLRHGSDPGGRQGSVRLRPRARRRRRDRRNRRRHPRPAQYI